MEQVGRLPARQSLALQTPGFSPISQEPLLLSTLSPSANRRVFLALLSPDRGVDMWHTCARSDLLALFPHRLSSLWRWRPPEPHLWAMAPALPQPPAMTKASSRFRPWGAPQMKAILKYVKNLQQRTHSSKSSHEDSLEESVSATPPRTHAIPPAWQVLAQGFVI